MTAIKVAALQIATTGDKSRDLRNVRERLDEQEGGLLTTLDLDEIDSIREQLPLLRARRGDMYRLETF